VLEQQQTRSFEASLARVLRVLRSVACSMESDQHGNKNTKPILRLIAPPSHPLHSYTLSTISPPCSKLLLPCG
jgi:hypothetical protein